MTHQLIFLCLLLISKLAFATDFNYEGYPVGERAAGMGGAYTALSNTPEGSFYNPAGIAFSNNTTISLSTNIYHWTKGTAKNAISVGGDTADLPVDSMEVIPSSTSYLYKFNFPFDKKRDDDKKVNAFALSAYVPDSFAYSGDVNLVTSTVNSYTSLQVKDNTLLLGPSYSRLITDNFSLGASLFYHLRTFDKELFFRATAGTLFSQGYSNTEYTYGAIQAIAGAKLKLPHNFHLGLIVRPYTLKLHGGGKLYSTAVTTDSNVTTANTELVSSSVDTELTTPIKFAMGIGYELPEKLAITGDVLFYLPHTFTSAHDKTGSFSDVRLKQLFTVNGKIGGEYYVRRSIPIRLGAFTNLSAAPNPETGTAATSKIDYYGGTFSVGYEKKHTTYNLGVQYAYGFGKLLDSTGTANDFNIYTISAILGGSYKF